MNLISPTFNHIYMHPQLLTSLYLGDYNAAINIVKNIYHFFLKIEVFKFF